MRRQTAKDDRARRRRTNGTPSRAQGVRQRTGGADRAAGAGRQGCLFCCDKQSPGCVGRARPSLVRRTQRTPPRSLLRLPASPRVSLGSRRNPSGDRPPAAALECQDICETVHPRPPFAPWRRYTPPSALSCSVPRCPWERGRGRLSLSPRSLPGR